MIVADANGSGTTELVLLDDSLVPREEAAISPFDRGVMYGESLFETLKVVDGAPCLWDLHSDRLTRGCEELGIALDPVSLAKGIARLLEQRRVGRGVLRVQVTGGMQPGGGRGLTAPAAGRAPRIVASATEHVPLPDSVYRDGVPVVASARFARSTPHLKSGSYLSSVRAKDFAESAGAFECILLGGEPPRLLEGSFSNVLAWDGARLSCPPEGGRLPGVTLHVVLRVAAARDLPVMVREVSLSEARGCGVLLTGSLLGVCHCSRLDGEALEDSSSVAAELRAGLADREARSREDWRAAWTVSM
jgi:branched-subunit amino acid aminotransferase/4-amino-4-deoxychorismate lyase